MGRTNQDERLADIRELADQLANLSNRYAGLRADVAHGSPEWQMAYSVISESLDTVVTKVEALSESDTLAS